MPVNGDLLDEIDETFFVNLSSPVNATIADGQGLGTITDDDAAPALSIDDVTVTEGNAGHRRTRPSPSRSRRASGQTVTVDYATADGTATAPGDYAAASGHAHASPPGETTKTVAVHGRTATLLDEIDETFFVNLANAIERHDRRRPGHRHDHRRRRACRRSRSTT